MDKKKFCVIGGDLRSLKLIELLRKDGHTVNIYGFAKSPDIGEFHELEDVIKNSDIIIGPLPCSNDDETVNAPFCTQKIYINDIFKVMKKNQIFVAGRISNKTNHLSEVYGVYTIDILDREEMAVLNAIPTAEGALQIAMEEMEITLHDCNALVMGFGRIGKILAKMLHSLSSNTYVEARKYSDIAWINSYGYKPILFADLEKCLPSMDVVFNTIPAMVLNEKLLNKVRKDCLIIDLASKPGGVDFEKANELGLKVNWALSLPGKVAPTTAAKIIRNTIYNILEELGV